jgi:hypothetical protein
MTTKTLLGMLIRATNFVLPTGQKAAPKQAGVHRHVQNQNPVVFCFEICMAKKVRADYWEAAEFCNCK